MVDANKPAFNNVVVFSGGSTRFAMYGGMYAALVDLGYKPDLVIATCGGAIATTVINSFDTNSERLAYFKSDELYKFTKATRLTDERKLHRIGLLCLKQIRNKKKAPYIEDVLNRYLVDIPQDLSASLPSLSTAFNQSVRSIIVGSKLLFTPSDVGLKRHNKKLYQRILFTDSHTEQSIDLRKIDVQSANYYDSAIDCRTTIINDVPITIAARISIADMFYLKPVFYNNSYFAGGAIDLIPIELACNMGKNVFFELKDNYKPLEEAMIRGVFGYSANERLAHVHAQDVYKWIDTRSAGKYLKDSCCTKKIDFLKLEINITMPQSHKQYTDNIQTLWDYGYLRIQKTMNK